MHSIESAYKELQAAIDASALHQRYQTTTSLAPELGLQEMTADKNRRDYERHDGGKTLRLIWRQTMGANGGPERHHLTVTLSINGDVMHRHEADFAAG